MIQVSAYMLQLLLHVLESLLHQFVTGSALTMQSFKVCSGASLLVCQLLQKPLLLHGTLQQLQLQSKVSRKALFAQTQLCEL